jgi:hypothetical protein
MSGQVFKSGRTQYEQMSSAISPRTDIVGSDRMTPKLSAGSAFAFRLLGGPLFHQVRHQILRPSIWCLQCRHGLHTADFASACPEPAFYISSSDFAFVSNRVSSFSPTSQKTGIAALSRLIGGRAVKTSELLTVRRPSRFFGPLISYVSPTQDLVPSFALKPVAAFRMRMAALTPNSGHRAARTPGPKSATSSCTAGFSSRSPFA